MKEKYLILLSLILIFSFGFHYLSQKIIKEKNLRIEKLDGDIKKIQEKLNSAKVLNEQLKEVSKVINNTISKEKDFSSGEINAVIKNLADLANMYKIAVNSMFPKVVYSQGKILEQEYVMDVTCTYIQLGQIISSMESSDNIIKIKTIDVRPIKSDDKTSKEDLEQTTRYKVVIELSTFKIVKEA